VIVAALVGELSGGQHRRPALDDSLDRDLGISSLERVELLLRLEQAFGVRLPDQVMAEAETARDLVTAIQQAAPAAVEPVTIVRHGTTQTTLPVKARSLVDVLHWHAEHTPDRVHLYLRNEDGTETAITYGQLMEGALALAAGLRDTHVGPGDRVALVLRTERAFFEMFAATLLAGAVPVPLYPPIRSEDLVAYTSRQREILRNAEPRVLVTFDEAERLATLMRSHVPSLETVTTSDRLVRTGMPHASEHGGADDPALIQYTSGSTGSPKGVLLSHANIIANVRAIGAAFDITPDDVGVSWLPLYHDMGLIGMWLGALYFGAPAAIMSPLAFLSRPSRWLWSLHAHGGTISAAPNFAFDLCARKVTDEEIEGLDLSRWRIAVNGAEAVSADTVERFARRFAPYGFSEATMCPSYGLAESSVALATNSGRHPPRIDRIARDPLERQQEIKAAGPDEPRTLRLVSSGRPLSGHEIRIVDADSRPLGTPGTSATAPTGSSSSRDERRTSSSREDATSRQPRWKRWRRACPASARAASPPSAQQIHRPGPRSWS
jgi:acyl carrier protein